MIIRKTDFADIDLLIKLRVDYLLDQNKGKAALRKAGLSATEAHIYESEA